MNKAVLIVRLWNLRLNIDIGCFLFGKFMSDAEETNNRLVIIQALELTLKLRILKHLINHIRVEPTTRLPIINYRVLLI